MDQGPKEGQAHDFTKATPGPAGTTNPPPIKSEGRAERGKTKTTKKNETTKKDHGKNKPRKRTTDKQRIFPQKLRVFPRLFPKIKGTTKLPSFGIFFFQFFFTNRGECGNVVTNLAVIVLPCDNGSEVNCGNGILGRGSRCEAWNRTVSCVCVKPRELNSFSENQTTSQNQGHP